MRSLSLGALPAFSLALLLPGVAQAGGFVITDVGTRETGMGAEVGRPDEPAAVYHNPAGLTLLPGLHVYVDGAVALTESSVQLHAWAGNREFINTPTNPQGYYPSVKPTRAFGAIPIVVVSDEVIPRKLWVGLAAYVPNATGGAFSPTAVTRYDLISGYSIAGYAGLTAAYRFDKHLSLAASADLVYIQMALNHDLYPVIKGTDYSFASGKNPDLTLHGNAFTYSFNMGLLYRPVPILSLGAAVITGSSTNAKGQLEVTASSDGLLPSPLTGTQQTNLYIPWTLLAGANWDASPMLEIGAELHYWLYSGYRTQVTDINWTSQTGFESALPTSLVSQEDYHDSWRVSGGVRLHALPHLGSSELMLGLHYDHSPVANANVSLTAPTFNNWGVHYGARYTVADRYRFGLTYVHYQYLERDITDSVTNPPSNGIAKAAANIITLSAEIALGGGYE